jgi:hypothetical protein
MRVVAVEVDKEAARGSGGDGEDKVVGRGGVVSGDEATGSSVNIRNGVRWRTGLSASASWQSDCSWDSPPTVRNCIM